MAALVYVQGVKAFHRHDTIPVKYKTAASTPALHHTHDCTICDYHLSKDAVVPLIPAIQEPAFYYITEDTPYLYIPVQLFKDTQPDRGPPTSRN